MRKNKIVLEVYDVKSNKLGENLKLVLTFITIFVVIGISILIANDSYNDKEKCETACSSLSFWQLSLNRKGNEVYYPNNIELIKCYAACGSVPIEYSHKWDECVSHGGLGLNYKGNCVYRTNQSDTEIDCINNGNDWCDGGCWDLCGTVKRWKE